jgi:Tfp pilus assembly protein PilN
MRLVGLDVGEREVRVARAERLFGTLRVTAIERRPRPGGLEACGGARGATVLTALPAAAVTHRVLTLPFRDRRRLARTVPYELLGQLPVDSAGLAVAFAPLATGPAGTTLLAVAVRQADLEAHAAVLAAAGLAPARIELAPLPAWNLVAPAAGDAALLVADGGRSTLSVRRNGRLAGLRALAAPADDPSALAAEVRWSLAALGGAPCLVVAGADADAALAAVHARGVTDRIVPLAGAAPDGLPAGDVTAAAVAVGLVLGAARRAPAGVVLRGAEPAPGSVRRVAVLAALAAALGLADLALVRRHLVRRAAALAAAVRAEAAAALPGARLAAPRTELEAALATARRRDRLGAGPGALALLREVSARVPPSLRLDLDEMVVEADGIHLHGRAESFDAVDALRRALAASPILGAVVADETRTTVDGRRVEFRLHAVRRSASEVPS